jgi:hypothetical protein
LKHFISEKARENGAKYLISKKATFLQNAVNFFCDCLMQTEEKLIQAIFFGDIGKEIKIFRAMPIRNVVAIPL